MLIGCIPLAALATPPTDQTDPIVESCPECGQDMWVSQKKRTLRDSGVPCMCMQCAIITLQGVEPQLFDLNDLTK